jgi:hypothetical protein
MDVIFQLNDIFDVKSPTIIEQRIDKAFGADGKNFWANFFFCDKLCAKKKIVYLFTEYQLSVIWSWWKKKINESDAETIKILEFSKQQIYRTLVIDGKMIDSLCVYCIKHDAANQYKLQRIYFGVHSYAKDNIINFFDGHFNAELINGVVAIDNTANKLIDFLEKIRPKLEKTFNKPRKNEKEWVYYLVKQGIDYGKHKIIKYCTGLDVDCPFIRNDIYALDKKRQL